jgi:hypothetical protein
MRDDLYGSTKRKLMRRRVSFGFVQDRIIVTAKRKKADLKSKKMSMMPVQERDGGKRKRALTLPGPPTDGKE